MNVRAASLFALVSILWGIPYLFIKVAMDHGFTPLSLVWMRLVLAVLILLPLAARAGALKQLKGHWKAICVYAIVEIAIPFPMIANGERRIASSTAAIVIACVPLLVALLALGFDRADRITRRQLGGLLVGFAGVVLLVGVGASSSHELLGIGEVFIAAIGYALGPLILRNYFQDVDARASMAATMVIAAIVLTPWAALDLPTRTPSVSGFAAVVALGVLCSAAAFVAMALLIREVGAPRAVVITYVNPVIALVLGTIFLSERPGISSIAGLALILLGSWASAAERKVSDEPLQPEETPPQPELAQSPRTTSA